MKKTVHKAVAIVGIGAVMPDAKDVAQFWSNIKNGKYSISETPQDRWDIAKYYNEDRKAPDKTYSMLGGWVKEDNWNPLKWRLPIPPKVSDQMDYTQKWAITATRDALLDFGYPDKDFNKDRTAVILGVAMGGDQHLYSAARILYPEYEEMLTKSDGFAALPGDMRNQIITEVQSNLDIIYPGITEDTMPGELSNIVAGRIAALFNFHGPNYIVDAACASAIAGISAAIEGLEEYDFDMVVTGGIDSNMAASTFVKFCKIGALSATGTRPYAEGADGFIMGEGGAVFILKRLEDAERDGDKIYAVIRSIGGSSDGKGKGITAPNPIGQQLAVKRAWGNAGISPATVSLIEGHGTSTSVGDAVELECLNGIFGDLNLPVGSVALGSVKSNIGHLKGAAGAAGIMKATMALHERVLPPSLNFHKPNPGFDFNNSPFAVNTELRPWEMKNGDPRRCGVSAFGFGGTNFHVVMEEYIPGKILAEQRTQISTAESIATSKSASLLKSPLRGALVKGTDSIDGLLNYLEELKPAVKKGWTPERKAPDKSDLQALFRIAIDFDNADDLYLKLNKAIKGLKTRTAGIWKALHANGIFFGEGASPKTAFLFTGQGSQYINMLKVLKDNEPIVKKTFDEADEIMTPLLGKPLTEYIFFENDDKEAIKEAAKNLMQTEITQPAMLTADIALFRLMKAYGIKPDFVIGHSLGEYGALVAAEAISFGNALKAVSARGAEMAKVQVDDKGIMAAVFGSPEDITQVISKIDGYVEIANINSYGQSVIGGETEPVLAAMKACKEAGLHVAQLPVSHAFHTNIVAPASGPLGKVLENCGLQSPSIPVIANVTGDFYPTGPDVTPQMVDILSKQVASPVQFVKGINRLYENGVRVFVEMGPKKALNGFVRDIMSKNEGVMNLFTNHPKVGAIASFNQGLCGLYASGIGSGSEDVETATQPPIAASTPAPEPAQTITPPAAPVMQASSPAAAPIAPQHTDDKYIQLGHLFVNFMEKANSLYAGNGNARPPQDIWITGAAVGLPHVEGVFQDTNVEKLLRGDQLISNIPPEFQQAMLDKNITRLVKSKKGAPRFETLSNVDDVIKLAARKLNLDIARDFGFPKSWKGAIDTMTELAIGAGIDALRDAGIPMVMHYKTTTTGTKLPERWLLPAQMKDDTGIIFASAFPGYNAYAKEMTDFYENKLLRDQLSTLQFMRTRLLMQSGNVEILKELGTQIEELENKLLQRPYSFNRHFLLRVLSMGHAQFAQYIGARGPNTQINSACASTTMAVGMAKDWIEAGRCRRVIIIAGDDVTSDDTIDWFSSGFLAVGAAATDAKVEDAALPFDKRRHGMIVGMGGVSIVVESGEAARERGIHPICEVLGTASANSAFHATRLDIDHIRFVMEKMVSEAEQKWGIDRAEIAAQTVFVSHETYTPARGGSASAEINALRYVFKSDADKIVIANTKGMTGHAMAVGIEDVLAIKSLETGLVPPVPNFKVIDPELGQLNLSKGGAYPIRYALRLGAGFGSQISMSLTRWTPMPNGIRKAPAQLGFDYRIADPVKWKNFLKEVSEKENPELEVFKRTLRVKDPLAEKLNDVVEGSQAGSNGTPVVEATKVAAPVMESTTKPAEPSAIKTKILGLIAEKTGYPADMLDPELDLEADLGIDTVKQAELFAEIRGEYGIERDDNLQLSDYPTLNHIIQFVLDKRPDLKEADSPVSVVQTAAAPKATTAAAVAAPVAGGGVKDKVLALIAEKTGYPEDMLDLELDLEADLGIDTVKQAELFAEIRGEYGIERDDNLQLSDYPTLNHIIQFVIDKRPDLKDQVSVAPVTVEPAEEKVIQQVVTQKPAAVSSASSNGVKGKILTLIAEKTGYPEDMLDLDLDLEADLGIDTVKQAELFAEIRGEYDIERDDNLQLSDYPTLNHIIQFVLDKRPDLQRAVEVAEAIAQPEVQPTAPVTSAPASNDGVKAKILTLIAEKTGYPEDMLDLDLDLEADLGIDTVKQAELFAEIRGEYDIERDDNLQLSDYPTLNHIIRFVLDRRPDLQQASAPTPAVETETAQSNGQPAATVTAPAPTGDIVKNSILALIAEKTGYPEDMLDLDLDLEADLGIDTVKQAELFAQIRESYGIERDDNLQLSDYPTINHIIAFVHDRRPSDEQTATATATVSSKSEPTAGPQLMKGDMDAVSQIPRRIPVPILRPALKYCKSSGVQLDSNSRVLVMSDFGGVGTALMTQLKKLGVKVNLLNEMESPGALKIKLTEWVKEGPVHGVFWLPTLDNPGDISKMKYNSWKTATQWQVKMLYATMRELMLLEQEEVFLVSATRMGGQFGYDDRGALAPLGGAVSGFTKAYKREHPEVHVKVVDFEKSRKTTAFAKCLIDETLLDNGAVEIGYKNDHRWSIGLEEKPLAESKEGMELTKDSTFLVTGAAGSITSAITADLAAASGGTFYMLDLTPKPYKDDPDLLSFAQDKEGLKRDIFTRLKEAGEKATPVNVDKELAAIERRYSALAAIQAVEQAGGTATYYSVNLLDNKAVAKVIKEIKTKSDKIDVLLHAGGLEISRLLPDKSPEEFDLVFDVKADGWFNMLSALGKHPIGATVVFSSIAGRFGNGGQVDYSAANDFLCKSVSNFRSTRKGTRGIALDWTAWKDIGMAARGSIPTVMRQAGIDMLPPAAGIPFIRKELTSGTGGHEIVVAQSLGMMMNEYDPNGGLEIQIGSALDTLVQKAKGVMVQKVESMGLYTGLVTKATLNPEDQAFLFDHQINGTPVLPGVMGIEAMVEATKLLFPGKHLKAVEEVDFLAPFKFYRSESRDVFVRVQFTMEEGEVIGNCTLYGSRKLLGQEEAEVKTHFTAKVRLSENPPESPTPIKGKLTVTGKKAVAQSEDIYQLYFHGPAYQVIDKSWKKGKDVIGQFTRDLPANHAPEKLETQALPRLIELCFQTAGIWEMGADARMGLPMHFDSLRFFGKEAIKKANVFAKVSRKNGAYNATIVDQDGKVILELEGYTTAEFISDFDKKLLVPLQTIVG